MVGGWALGAVSLLHAAASVRPPSTGKNTRASTSPSKRVSPDSRGIADWLDRGSAPGVGPLKHWTKLDRPCVMHTVASNVALFLFPCFLEDTLMTASNSPLKSPKPSSFRIACEVALGQACWLSLPGNRTLFPRNNGYRKTGSDVPNTLYGPTEAGNHQHLDKDKQMVWCQKMPLPWNCSGQKVRP